MNISKSSNEILTELFGAFNSAPPVVNEVITGDDEESRSSKRKRSKSKKSKKKRKSKKSKKYPSSSSHGDNSSDDGYKKRNSKEKVTKKKNDSANNLNIEVPIHKVPAAIEIMLDGTVGIKGDDGVMTTIESDIGHHLGTENKRLDIHEAVNGSIVNIPFPNDGNDGTFEQNIDPKNNSLITEVFEKKQEQADGKKGKIQIKNLKFSSVYQETVKAVEEEQKKKEEKKANYEEGELSDSSDSDKNSDYVDPDNGKSTHKRKHSSKTHHDDHRSHQRKRRSSSRSKSRRDRDRSRHRNRSVRSKSKHRDHSKSHRGRSRSRERERDRDRLHKVKYSPNSKSHRSSGTSRSRSHRSRSKERSEKVRHRSRSKEPSTKSGEKIDKEKLLAIAKKNAMKLIDAGVLPGAEKMTINKGAGKTVNELTEYCKKLSKREALGDEVSDIESDSSEDDDKAFHHPFQVRDRPNSIVMNIKNSVPLPVRSLQEKTAEQSKQLRLQFPVSSGSSHRKTESEWVPVSPKKTEPELKPVKIQPPLPPERPPLPPAPAPPPPSAPLMVLSAVPPPEPLSRPVFPVIQPAAMLSSVDISTIVSKRLEAIRRLQENPNDSQALSQMYHAQQEMQYWAESKQETGAFTGSTGAKMLTASELSSGVQAWAKRDQLTNATPVKGGMGMALLQKMGWQPGEGLGKNKEGTLEPLKLEVKMDKKGLLAADEGKKGGRKQSNGPALPTVKTLDGKHPVSLLNEFCSRRRLGIPTFEICLESGPDHKKCFLFKVKVNGVEYTPNVASPNKKQAKAEAAAICLQALGIITNSAYLPSAAGETAGPDK